MAVGLNAGIPSRQLQTLGLTIVRPNFLSTPETLGSWTDSRISCWHLTSTSFLGYPLYVFVSLLPIVVISVSMHMSIHRV